ncbi:MAG TPA: methylamine utilization protein [Thermoanaerobaculia bacterium]|nr:methylamine utilization protein [Thermoanaerobaculia bacterium]
MFRPVLALVTILTALPLAAASLEVNVTYPDGSAVPNAVIYAVPARTIPIRTVVASIDQVNRTFVPHVLPVRTGTWVEFPNSDNVLHQVYSLSPAKRFQLPLYIGKPARPIQFDKEGVVAIGCNVHEQMSGFIVVVPTPYFGTAVNGRLTLKDLGADDYTVHVWYEGMRNEPEPRVVKLAADGVAALAFVAAK